jgi:hypothetical protein
VRWQAHARILRSRLHRLRKEYAAARDEAKAAINATSGKQEVLACIDAHAAHAEALLLLHEPEVARDNIAEAFRLLERRKPSRNRKIEAVLHLLSARSYVMDAELARADAEVDQWLLLKDTVEHAVVHEMASDVHRRVMAVKKDFTVPWAAPVTAYHKLDSKLRAWAIWRAQCEPGIRTKGQIAAALDISRPTLNAWEDDPSVKEALQERRELAEETGLPTAARLSSSAIA